jgi:hypothetical protein
VLSGETSFGLTTPLKANEHFDLDLDEKFDEAFADEGEFGYLSQIWHLLNFTYSS